MESKVGKRTYTFIEGLEIGRGQRSKKLAVFPLLGRSAGPYCTLLKDALNDGCQLEETGRVNVVKVKNEGKKKVLITKGEMITGGMQNRMFDRHALVDKGQEVNIPVHCVEKGRWGYAGERWSYVWNQSMQQEPDRERPSWQRPYRDYREASPAEQFKYMASAPRQVSMRASSQSAVWQATSAHLSHTGVASATSDLGEAVEKQREDPEFVKELAEFSTVSSQLGVVIAWRSENKAMWLAEVYCRKSLLEGRFKDILGSVLFGVKANLGDLGQVSMAGAKEFLRTFANVVLEKKSEVGLGSYYEGSTDGLQANILEHEDKPVLIQYGS